MSRQICPACGQPAKRKSNSEITDEGNIQSTVCAHEDCGYKYSSHLEVERADGSKMFRPRAIPPEEQPELKFASQAGGGKPEDNIPTAAELMEIAMRTREETIGKVSREIAKEILDICAKPENVLKGEYSYLMKENEVPAAEVMSTLIKDLKARGYKIKKEVQPGEGTWINVKWPTTRKGQRKPKHKKNLQPQGEEKEVSFPKEKKMTTREKQKAAAKYRKKALKEKSNLPK